MRATDAIVVGGGIVGAACAWDLLQEGLSVTVLEAAPGTGGGATAAGMGHIIVLDDSEAQFRLTRWSQQLWNGLAAELPSAVQRDPCGCIWVAADDEEMRMVHAKAAFYRERGVEVEILDPVALAAAEGQLRDGLAGGLRMVEDSVVYPPAFVGWLLQRGSERGMRVETGVRVIRVDGEGVLLADGSRRAAGIVVDAAGDRALELLPEPLPGIEMRPRKGHLAITARVPGFCRHQLVELGYLRSAHTHESESVAFNVQPRQTGQVLIGSSRQYGDTERRVNPRMLRRMLRRAMEFLPGLASLPVVRTWTGFRAATEDKLPLIGPVPGHEGLFLASGHEGLGITTSLGTGALVAAMVGGRQPAIDPSPYLPDRGRREAA